MTDNLLQKLEEKMMTLLAELESLRKETNRLTQENNSLKVEYGNYVKKLQNIVSLMDSLDSAHPPVIQQQDEVVEDVDYAQA